MYLVFDYAHNRDLATHVLLHGGTDKQLTNEQIRTYVSQLLSATVYCHDRLVYHCAIELKHLLITRPGQLKLANFQYAKHAVRPTVFIDCSDVRIFKRRHLHEGNLRLDFLFFTLSPGIATRRSNTDGCLGHVVDWLRVRATLLGHSNRAALSRSSPDRITLLHFLHSGFVDGTG